MSIKPHLQSISCLQDSIQSIKEIAESMPDSTLKGRLLANTDALEDTTEKYLDNTLDLYDKVLNFAMRVAI